MGFQQFLAGKNWIIAVVVVVAGVMGFWLGMFHDKGNPAAINAGKAPVGIDAAKPNTSFADANTRLEDLMRRQQALSQQATAISALQRPAGTPVAGARTTISGNSGKRPSEEELRKQAEAGHKQMEALIAARNTATDEILHAGPGDTNKIIAAMAELDSKMRAAGVPSVLDMDKFRQMMLGAARMQEIAKQLAAENKKGQQADSAKIQSLSNELSALQASMPKSPYNTEALDKVMRSGR